MTINVLLVDDHRLMCAGLRALLEKEPDICVAAEAGNGLRAIHLAGELRPDVIVMDLNMPEMGGIESIHRISAEFPETRVLALSMESGRPFVTEALKAGAKGYLVKDCAAEELVKAVRTVAAGDLYLGPKITELIVNDYIQGTSEVSARDASHLSPREQEVLARLADGMSTKEIAYVLGVSVKTVEAQRLNIMKKLDLHSIAELTKYAIRHRLTSIR